MSVHCVPLCESLQEDSTVHSARIIQWSVVSANLLYFGRALWSREVFLTWVTLPSSVLLSSWDFLLPHPLQFASYHSLVNRMSLMHWSLDAARPCFIQSSEINFHLKFFFFPGMKFWWCPWLHPKVRRNILRPTTSSRFVSCFSLFRANRYPCQWTQSRGRAFSCVRVAAMCRSFLHPCSAWRATSAKRVAWPSEKKDQNDSVLVWIVSHQSCQESETWFSSYREKG